MSCSSTMMQQSTVRVKRVVYLCGNVSHRSEHEVRVSLGGM
jgi:hypothetical protein